MSVPTRQNYTASHPRRCHSSLLPLQKPQILNGPFRFFAIVCLHWFGCLVFKLLLHSSYATCLTQYLIPLSLLLLLLDRCALFPCILYSYGWTKATELVTYGSHESLSVCVGFLYIAKSNCYGTKLLPIQPAVTNKLDTN
jgi:hypothetical protein